MTTFQYDYITTEGSGDIQFCAANIDEANELYNEYMSHENCVVKSLMIYDKYNQADAAEYGDYYKYDGIFYKYEGRDMQGVVVPDGITTILSGAFSRSEVDWIQLPESLTYIGHSAFANCHELTHINIPNGITFIGTESFKNCTKLKEIDLPVSVELVGGNAFEGCCKLETINLPRSLKSICGHAFKDCKSLIDLYIPEACAKNIEMINNSAFAGANNVVLHCSIDSDLVKYAERNNIKYQLHPPQYVLQLLPNEEPKEIRLSEIEYRHCLSEISEIMHNTSGDLSFGQLRQKQELEDTVALVNTSCTSVKDKSVIIINKGDTIGLSLDQMERAKKEYSHSARTISNKQQVQQSRRRR